MKQIRLKDRIRKVQRCWDCPMVQTNKISSIDPWFNCRAGGTIPNRTSLMAIPIPDDCPLEDLGDADLGTVAKIAVTVNEKMPCGDTPEVYPCYNCESVQFLHQKACAYCCGKATGCKIAGVVDFGNPACEDCQHAPFNIWKKKS